MRDFLSQLIVQKKANIIYIHIFTKFKITLKDLHSIKPTVFIFFLIRSFI